MKKKLIIVCTVLLSLILLGIVTFIIKFNTMKKVTETAYNSINTIDLTKYSDGIYEGAFKQFLIEAQVDVTIKNHTIVDIKIVKQKSSPKYEAHDTIDRILRKQNPKVDATTGATGSSMALMIATADALSEE